MLHLQTHPVHNYSRSIQAVILHPHQFDGLQIVAKYREEMLRNNYDQVNQIISHKLSSAPHSTGAQNQTQSHVVRTCESDEARGLINGQQPQPVQTAHPPGKGVKRDTPPNGNKRSLVHHVGETLKWRDRSHTIGCHAQWAKQYNGIRYLLQYVHWQIVRPRLMPISEWEERTMNEKLAQIARSAEHETLSHRVVGSNLHEKLQKLQMITTSSNHSSTSLECHDCPVIRHTSTPCSQLIQPKHDAMSGTNCDRRLNNLQDVSSLPSRGQSTNDREEHNAFPENSGKFIASFHQHSTKGCYSRSPETRQKSMHKPRYNCKFTGCMQGKRRLSVEWISNNNQQSLFAIFPVCKDNLILITNCMTKCNSIC